VGAFAEGNARAAETLRIAEAAEVTTSRIQADLAMGLVALRQGELNKAIAVLERGLGLCQSANLPFWFPRVGSALGCAYTLTGRVAEGLPLLEQAVTQAVAIGQMLHQPLWVAYLAEAYLISGRREDAMVHGERALALAREHKERGHEAWTLRLLGEIAARHAPPQVGPAEAHYQQALALADELGMRPLMAHCHHGLGTLYAVTGQQEQARMALSAAIALYRALDMIFWLPPAEAALEQLEAHPC
jgi:tetratricopeptide (TPR) repeat protein